MAYTPEELHAQMERLEEKMENLNTSEKENGMNDIAGLLALMNQNKNMDLPGLLALCKERGYHNSFGGEGSFLFIFLLFFLFAGGGWGNIGARNQEAFAAMAGNQCQDIIGIHDRISAAQAASTQGFQSIQTWLCESISNVVNQVRNQGDRAVEAVNTVSTQLASCCCEMKGRIDAVLCKVDGLYAHTSLLQERNMNAMQSMECRLSSQIKDVRNDVAIGFERQGNLINTKFAEEELARLRRENTELKLARSQDAQTAAIIAAIGTTGTGTNTGT